MNKLRAWVMLLGMCWASIWCCCAPAVAQVAAKSVHSCCMAKAGVDSSLAQSKTCHAPASSSDSDCPFIQARQVSWIDHAPATPEFRPIVLLAIALPTSDISPLVAQFVQLPSLTLARPPGALVDLHVCLLC